jgi:hypothetical protein
MGAKAKQDTDLQEVQSEQQFHEREWAVQRFGWTLLALFLIAGISGVFGDGPLAHLSIASENGQIEFDRFARRHAPTEWAVSYRQNRNTSEMLELAIDAEYLRKFEVRAITPEPETTRITEGAVLFRFEAEGASGRVVLHVEPQQPGFVEGTFRLNDAPALTVRQIIYP